MFKGTLFETELVRTKGNKWFLLIGDIYFHKSSSCKNIMIMDRMNLINDIFEKNYNSDSFCDVCPIQIKRFFDYSEKDYLMNEGSIDLPSQKFWKFSDLPWNQG